VRALAARPVPVLLAALVLCGAVVAAAMWLLPPLSAALAGVSPAVVELLFTVLLFVPLAGIAFWGRRLSAVEAAADAAPRAQALTAGVLTGVGGLALALALARTAGAVGPGAAGPVSAGAFALLLGTTAVLGQSAAEELFFRGWLQPVLVRSWGPAAGVAATAAAFAALHLAGGARSPATLVNLAAGGVLFGLLALRSGGLWAPVAAHAAWNWSEIVGLGLSPNPGIGSFGSLVDLDLVGSPWWGGSDEGLNASGAAALVLVALVLPLLIGRGGWPFGRPVPAGGSDPGSG